MDSTDVRTCTEGAGGASEPPVERGHAIRERDDFDAAVVPAAAAEVQEVDLGRRVLLLEPEERTQVVGADPLARGHLERPQAALARRQMIDPRGRFQPGTMIYFELADPSDDGLMGARLIDWIATDAYAITLAVSLGQVKTLIEHPFSMTHSALPEAEKRGGGVDPRGIRLSVGLEDPDDLIADLERALAVA